MQSEYLSIDALEPSRSGCMHIDPCVVTAEALALHADTHISSHPFSRMVRLLAPHPSHYTCWRSFEWEVSHDDGSMFVDGAKSQSVSRSGSSERYVDPMDEDSVPKQGHGFLSTIRPPRKKHVSL